MKTAKITQVQSGNKSGDYNYFEYTLDNGYSGSAAQKASESFGKVGDVIEYEEGKFKNGNNKIEIKKKLVGPSVNVQAEQVANQKKNTEIQGAKLDFDKDKQILIIRQSSIKASVDFLQARTGVTFIEVLSCADVFTNYVLTGKIPDVTELDKLPF